MRPNRITVCKLPALCNFVPRGRARNQLKPAETEGAFAKCVVDKRHEWREHKKEIGQVFNTEEWRYLDVKQDNSLSMSDEQLPDGHNLCSRRGCVYILVSSSKG